MSFTDHHVPYKFARRGPNIRGAIARHAQGDTIDAQALENILDEVFSAQSEEHRQDWLEIERWTQPAAAAAGSTLYDAIIDPALSSADADNHQYPNLTSLLANETWGATYVFCVGVRFRPTIEVVETGATGTIPGPILIEAIAKGGGTSATAGWTSNAPTTDPARAPWDLNGSTFHTTGSVALSGLQIYNTGTTRGSVFLDSDLCFLNNCIFNSFSGATRKLNDLTGGTLTAWDTFFSGPLFSGRVVCTDCHYEVLSTSGTVDWFAADVYWDGGAWAGTNSGNATLRILDQFYIRFAHIDSTLINSTASSATGCTIDIRGTSSGTFIMPDDGVGQSPNVVVRAAADDVKLYGHYDDITVEACTNAGAVRVLDCTCNNIADLSGPRLIGQVRTTTTAGRVICRGVGMNLRCSGTIGSTGVFLSLINCDDAIIVAQADGAAGTSQPYNIDAASDRSYVLFAGARVAAAPGFGAAGANASATTRVGTEVAGS